MVKDRMFYSFNTEKFIEVEPTFLLGPETPLLCRALRYGTVLKLEDLYTQYSSSIETVVHKLNCKKSEESNDNLFTNEGELREEKLIHEEEVKLESSDKKPEEPEFIEESKDTFEPPSRIIKHQESPLKTMNISTIDPSQSDVICCYVNPENYHIKRVK